MRHAAAGRALLIVALAVSVLLTNAGAAQQVQVANETARRQFESGNAFLKDGRHAEAMKDFEAVAQLFPSSDVADDALLAVASLHLDIYRDPLAARKALDKLISAYPAGTAAPMALVLTGRVGLVDSATPAALDASLASFDRVRRLFPTADAVPAASYYAGEALRMSRRFPDALRRFQLVLAESPRSQWAPRAQLAAARCLVQMGQTRAAMGELQGVRRRTRDAGEADRARDWNTLLFRLSVRPAASAFAYAGRALGATPGREIDARGVVSDAAGRFFIASDNLVRVIEPTGKEGRSFTVNDARGLFVDRSGTPRVFFKNGVQKPDGALGLITTKPPDKAVDAIEAVVMLGNGTILVADRNAAVVYRVDAQLAVQGVFTKTKVSRMAVGPQNEVALLERDTKSVAVVSAEGAPLFRIPERGTAYRLDEPVDVAFDALGYLYVLDRGAASVFVFDPMAKYVLTMTVPRNTPGAFRSGSALTVDGAGRVLVADDRTPGLLVFQ